MTVRSTILLAMLVALALPARGAHEMHEDADATVVILMFDGVQIIDFAAPYEVFGQAHFNVYTVSADGGPVTTAMGLNVNVDRSYENAPEADIILVPGGDVGSMKNDQRTLEWLQERSAASDQVLSVCNGAFIVAGAGLLEGRKATTFHRLFDEFEHEYPEVKLVTDQRWVDNGKVITSAGLASGVDAALHVVAKRLGEKKARSVALHLEYDWSPEHGFVRGLMADRHLRMPSEGLKFPEGTEIDTVLQVGDERHWEIEYVVDSPWSPGQLLDHLTAVADGDPVLEIVENESPLVTGWSYQSAHGGKWSVKLEAQPSDDGEPYTVTAKLEPLE